MRDDKKERRKLMYVWGAMRARCNNPKDKGYHNYGGRGIKVCARWDQSFQAFLEDMAPRPKGMLLDRRDNDGNYTPENCRWVTRTEQNSNRRNCIFVDVNGETVTLKEACRRLGLRYRPVVKRIQDRGWPVDVALSTPIGGARG